MGRLDTITKDYLSQNTVFADAFNFLIYDGRQTIQPEQLHELDTTELTLPYGTDQAAEPVQKYRDVLKSVSVVGMEDDRAAYLILGIESQETTHYAMPVRNMLYDALQYARQVEQARVSYRDRNNEKSVKLTREEFLSGFRKTDRLIPVITLVVFFSPECWDGPRSIGEMLAVEAKELEPFLTDYKINLIEPGRMKQEDFEKFQSGLGAVLLCMKHANDEDFSILEQPQFQQVDLKTAMLIKEVAQMEFEPEVYVDEKGAVNMCKAYENTVKKYRAEGEQIGLQRGKVEEKIAMTLGLHAMNIPVATIAKAAKVSVEQVQQWITESKDEVLV